MSTPFINAWTKAEGTIARAAGGRASWDDSVLRETALSAMAGNPAPVTDWSPEEYARLGEAFAAIQARTTPEHRREAYDRFHGGRY